MPGDMPLVRPVLLVRLIEEFLQAHEMPIVVPTTTSGEQRNPLFVAAAVFWIANSTQWVRGRQTLAKSLSDCRKSVRVSDHRVFADIDTANEVARLSHLFSHAAEDLFT
jgi:CTP:molybdopterin cytidylyltransferase MocA